MKCYVVDPCYLPDLSSAVEVELEALPTETVEKGFVRCDGGTRHDPKLGSAPVDSGQLCIIPAEAVSSWIEGDYGDMDNDYGRACEASLNGDGNFKTVHGHSVFVFGTAYGDGCYDVHGGGGSLFVHTGMDDCFDCDGSGEWEESCDDCDGLGYEETICDDCGGEGVPEDTDDEDEVCWNCDGEGTVEEDCWNCDTNGTVVEECMTCHGNGFTE